MTALGALVVFGLLQGAVSSAEAQAQRPQAPPAPITIEVPPSPQPRRISPIVVFSSGFESNVNRNAEDLDAVGVTVGAGLVFVNDPRKPTIEVSYQAGFHRYSSTNRWNRISHFARASWERSLSRDWTFDLSGEMSLKGSTEDRELGDQYQVSPRIEYRLDSHLRIRGVATYRLRRSGTDPGRDATNRYAGLELLGRPRIGPRWKLGGRIEENATREARRAYYRYTAYGGWDHPLGRWDRIETELKVRLQRYPNRLVDISGGPDIPREDSRWEPEVTWVHAFAHGEVRAAYSYERRASNDPTRGYHAHAMTFSVTARQ